MPRKRIPKVIVNDSSSGSEAEGSEPMSEAVTSPQPLEKHLDAYLVRPPATNSDNESELYFSSTSLVDETDTRLVVCTDNESMDLSSDEERNLPPDLRKYCISNSKQFLCQFNPSCGRSFENLSLLTSHLEIAHNQGIQEEPKWTLQFSDDRTRVNTLALGNENPITIDSDKVIARGSDKSPVAAIDNLIVSGSDKIMTPGNSKTTIPVSEKRITQVNVGPITSGSDKSSTASNNLLNNKSIYNVVRDTSTAVNNKTMRNYISMLANPATTSEEELLASLINSLKNGVPQQKEVQKSSSTGKQFSPQYTMSSKEQASSLMNELRYQLKLVTKQNHSSSIPANASQQKLMAYKPNPSEHASILTSERQPPVQHMINPSDQPSTSTKIQHTSNSSGQRSSSHGRQYSIQNIINPSIENQQAASTTVNTSKTSNEHHISPDRSPLELPNGVRIFYSQKLNRYCTLEEIKASIVEPKVLRNSQARLDTRPNMSRNTKLPILTSHDTTSPTPIEAHRRAVPPNTPYVSMESEISTPESTDLFTLGGSTASASTSRESTIQADKTVLAERSREISAESSPMSRDRSISQESSVSRRSPSIAFCEPGTEAQSTIPAQPSDGIWPFQLGYAFYMRKRYYCNVKRANECRKSFLNRPVLIQHLSYVHGLTERNAMTLRESEHSDILPGAIVDMLISTGLPCNAVENQMFNNMVAAIQGMSDNKATVPSIQLTRNLMDQQFKKNRDRIKKVLLDQKHTAYSVHVCHPLHDPKDNLMIVTAFYMDKTWAIRDMLVSMNSISFGNSDPETVIGEKFLEVLKSLGVNHIPFTVTCPDLFCTDMVENRGQSNSERDSFIPCIDRILERVKTCLFDNLDTDFGPLIKIHQMFKNLNQSGFKLLSPEISQRVREFNKSSKTTFDYLTQIPPIMDAFSQSAQTLLKEKLTWEEKQKISRIVDLITVLDSTLVWLHDALNFKYPTSNKTYIICTEILNSIYQLAHCYGCVDVNSLTDCRTYSDRPMLMKLSKIYTLLDNYRRMFDHPDGHHPIRKALILDTFVYNTFKGRENQYSKPYDANVDDRIRLLGLEDHVVSVTTAQATEILQMFKTPAMGFSIKRSRAGAADVPRKKNKSVNDVSRWEVKTTYYFDSEDDDTSDEDRNSNANGCGNDNGIENQIDMNMTAFIEIQQILLRCHAATTTTGSIPVSMLSNLFDEKYNFGQINFWTKADATYYPSIGQLTKDYFTIPTTSNVCHRLADRAKDYYSSLLCLFPDASHVENQQRTLMQHWDK